MVQIYTETSITVRFMTAQFTKVLPVYTSVQLNRRKKNCQLLENSKSKKTADWWQKIITSKYSLPTTGHLSLMRFSCLSPKTGQTMLWCHKAIVLIVQNNDHNEYDRFMMSQHCLASFFRQIWKSCET